MSRVGGRRAQDLAGAIILVGILASGVYLWKTSRKSDVLKVDASAARPTRHMAPMAARVDRAKVEEWLREGEGDGGAAGASGSTGAAPR